MKELPLCAARLWIAPLLAPLLALAATLPIPAATTPAEFRQQVRQTEIAFAKTMANRDPAAFAKFLSKEVVFMSAGSILRGPREVSEGWKGFFAGPVAPFSWEPENVEVLDSGSLAMSSGPVRDSTGKRVGTFNSVWRREAGGAWKIVIDNGCPACNCGAPAK